MHVPKKRRCTFNASGPAPAGRASSAFLVLVAALIALLRLLASGASGEPPPVRVGILFSQTGSMAGSETPLIEATRMAIDEVNERGGILGRRVEGVVRNGGSDPAYFAYQAERLITQDRVSAIFGCWTSASRKALLPVLARHRHLLWYPVQYEGFETSPYVIYTGATANQQIVPAVTWAVQNLGPRAFLVGSDYVFPRRAHRIIRGLLKRLGATCVGEMLRPLGSKDFAALPAAIAKAKPDCIFNTVNGLSNQALFTTLTRSGFSPSRVPVVSFSLAEVEMVASPATRRAGDYCAWSYFQSLDSPSNDHFVQAFRARYGAHRVTDDPMEAAYFQVHLYALAVRAAGSLEPRAVRAAAAGLIYDAPEGLVRIDPRNFHTWKVARVGRVRADGQFDVVWSSELPIRPLPFAPGTP